MQGGTIDRAVILEPNAPKFSFVECTADARSPGCVGGCRACGSAAWAPGPLHNRVDLSHHLVELGCLDQSLGLPLSRVRQRCSRILQLLQCQRPSYGMCISQQMTPQSTEWCCSCHIPTMILDRCGSGKHIQCRHAMQIQVQLGEVPAAACSTLPTAADGKLPAAAVARSWLPAAAPAQLPAGHTSE